MASLAAPLTCVPFQVDTSGQGARRAADLRPWSGRAAAAMFGRSPAPACRLGGGSDSRCHMPPSGDRPKRRRYRKRPSPTPTPAVSHRELRAPRQDSCLLGVFPRVTDEHVAHAVLAWRYSATTSSRRTATEATHRSPPREPRRRRAGYGHQASALPYSASRRLHAFSAAARCRPAYPAGTSHGPPGRPRSPTSAWPCRTSPSARSCRSASACRRSRRWRSGTMPSSPPPADADCRRSLPTRPPPWNDATAPTRSGTADAVWNDIGPPMQ